MKIRAVQFSPRLGDVPANLATHRHHVEEASRAGVELVVFPELAISGYHLMDLAEELALTPMSPEFAELASLSKATALITGAPFEATPGRITNSALCFADGELRHRHDKVQLPNFGMFQETMIFAPGTSFRTFLLGGFRIGILVCREILFPIFPYLYSLQRADLVVAISNSPHRGLGPEGFASTGLWETMGTTCSLFFCQHFLFVNRTGFEEGLGFPGGSFFARAGQGIETRAPQLDEATIDVELSLDEVRRARLAGNYLRDENPELALREIQRILHERDR
ncbi:MAG TPA: nitrilase-related carbon-nitrogen hydrolase [Candidatus Aminicenantes bacterium]|nr:nitrilase-related carbon-nitrogen hydrolase [Candidatus Aminicenantes bacterium]